MALFEEQTGALFTGDVIFNGHLIASAGGACANWHTVISEAGPADTRS
ncbi:hypothetical protein SRB17_84580 [Streptomyces sp. RB17]|nr:hypothetical protein [Streptomyces sp. RB17]MQY40425.1 hypothetical protein [Streptomyces sp. RB17]